MWACWIYYINRRAFCKTELTGLHVIIVLPISGYNEFITDLCSKPFPTTNLGLNSGSHGIKNYPMRPQWKAASNKYSQPGLTKLFNKYLRHTVPMLGNNSETEETVQQLSLLGEKKKRKFNISSVSALLDSFFCLGSCTSANLHTEHGRALYRN